MIVNHMSLWRQKKQRSLVASCGLDVTKFSRLGVLLLFVCVLATYPEVHAGQARYSPKNATSSLSSQISELKDELLENPDNVGSRYVLGILNLQLGAAIAAEKEFRRAQQYGWSRQLILPLLGEALLPQRSQNFVSPSRKILSFPRPRIPHLSRSLSDLTLFGCKSTDIN